MEQQLINSLVKLLAKAGGASLVRDMVRQIDENANPKVWTPAEVEKAIQYIEWQTENFGTAEAMAMIEALMKKYNIRQENLPDAEPQPETSGIQGLQ